MTVVEAKVLRHLIVGQVALESSQAMDRVNIGIHGDCIHGEDAYRGREVLEETPGSNEVSGVTDKGLEMASKRLELYI